MATPRLLGRVTSAKVVSVAHLGKHRLKFHKRSTDGSAKCDIELTNNPNDIVYGVVFQILVSEKLALDKKEGLGSGYEEKSVSVIGIDSSTESFNVTTYYATDIDSLLSPYHWYKEHVVRGAQEHKLPIEYIKTIEAVGSIPDPDPRNHEKELSIYR